MALSNASCRPRQVYNASDLFSDSYISAQASTSQSQGSGKGSTRAYQHANLFKAPFVQHHSVHYGSEDEELEDGHSQNESEEG